MSYDDGLYRPARRYIPAWSIARTANPAGQIAANARVCHGDYGDGIVQQVDGGWALVMFDGHSFATSVHVDDLQPA